MGALRWVVKDGKKILQQYSITGYENRKVDYGGVRGVQTETFDITEWEDVPLEENPDVAIKEVKKTNQDKVNLVIGYLENFFCKFVCGDSKASKEVRDRADFLLGKLLPEVVEQPTTTN